MVDKITADFLNMKSVPRECSKIFLPIVEKILECVHNAISNFTKEYKIDLNNFQFEIDLKCTRLKNIFDALEISEDYTENLHKKIFENDNFVKFENILDMRCEKGLNIINIKPPSVQTIKSIHEITTKPVSNAVRENVSKINTFFAEAFDTTFAKKK